jgi:hypothetical protein
MLNECGFKVGVTGVPPRVPQFGQWREPFMAPSDRQGETTLEPSGEDLKIHSKRV